MPIYEVAVKQDPVNRDDGTFSQSVIANKYIISYLDLKRSFIEHRNEGCHFYVNLHGFSLCPVKCSEPCHLFIQFLSA